MKAPYRLYSDTIQCVIAYYCSAIAILVTSNTLEAQTVTEIINNGPRANRLNMVFLSEGYTQAELTAKFPSDAVTIVNSIFATEPYHEYKNYFNVFLIAVASAESGSDHPPQNIFKDTYFNSTYNSYGIDRLLTIPPNDTDSSYGDGEGKVFELLASFVPDFDLVVLIVNDSTYGGSGGTIAVASTNRSSAEIATHESGHSFAGLGDEYEDPEPLSVSEEPNATQQTDRNLIKWHNWIAGTTPIPTPETESFSTVIGLFEGANYNPTGWYRPKLDCKMRTYGIPFCDVCAESFILNFMRRVSMIDASLPAATTLSLTAPNSVDFRVTKLTPLTHSLTVQWVVDNGLTPSGIGDDFTINASTLTDGPHTVRVIVRDPTPLVRTDRENDLTITSAWALNVTNSGYIPPARFGNISTRLNVGAGDNVAIAGFIINGTQPKKILMRATGPSLNVGGVPVPGRLADPTLELHDSTGMIGSNNDWHDSPDVQAIFDSTLAPADTKEAAIVKTLNPGTYSVIMRGVNDSTGVGLVEVYDLDPTADSKLANISTRGFVQTGDNVMIGGLIVKGTGSTRALIRALGPSLNVGGVPVPGRLADPILELHDSQGNVFTNDNWRDAGAEEIQATTVAPPNDLESALIAPLAPGNYTFIVRGKNGGTGVASIEAYQLNN